MRIEEVQRKGALARLFERGLIAGVRSLVKDVPRFAVALAQPQRPAGRPAPFR